MENKKVIHKRINCKFMIVGPSYCGQTVGYVTEASMIWSNVTCEACLHKRKLKGRLRNKKIAYDKG